MSDQRRKADPPRCMRTRTDDIVLRDCGDERIRRVLRVVALGQVAAVGIVGYIDGVRGVLTKLGVSSQLAAVAMARRSGWLVATEPDLDS